MKEESLSRNHYNFTYNPSFKAYSFQTDNLIDYRVAFIKDESFNTLTGTEEFQDLYQIVVEKVGDRKEPFDMRVSRTIEKLVVDFFRNEERAILYVCSQEERKELKRAMAFTRWYRNSPFRLQVEKMDWVVEFESAGKVCKIYSSLLFHHRNPQKGRLREAYHQMGEALSKPA